MGSGRATANPAGCVGAVSCGLSVDVRQCLQGELARGRVPRAAPWNGLCARAASSRVTVHRRLWGATGAVPSASHSNFQSLPARRRPINLVCASTSWLPQAWTKSASQAGARVVDASFHRAFLRLSVSARATPAAAPTWSWTFTKFTFKERRIKRKIPVKKNSDLRSKSCVRTCVLSAEHTQLAHK